MRFQEIFENIPLEELSDEEHQHLLDTEWNLPQYVTAWLKSKGLKRIGKGLFSEVFGREGSDKIVKVNKKKDSAYQTLIEYLETSDCKYLPKVYDFKEITPELYMYITERLVPFKGRQYEIKESDLGLFSYLYNKDSSILDRLSLRGKFLTAIKNKITQEKLSDYKRGKGIRSKKEIIQEYIESYITELEDDFTTTEDGRTLDYALNFNNDILDIHSGNVMIRPSTGDIVLSDPVANWKDLRNARW